MDQVKHEHQKEAAIQAWISLKGEVTDPASVETLQFRKRKPSVFRIWSDTESSWIICKLCSTEEAHREEIVFEKYLALLPISTLRFFGVYPSQEESESWLFVEDAGGEEYISSRKDHQAIATRWLGELHGLTFNMGEEVGLRDLRESFFLEKLIHVRETISLFLQNTSSNSNLGILQEIITHCDRIEAEWKKLEAICRQFPHTLVHGSFSHRNMRVRTGKPGVEILVYDWGAAGWGSAARDLARLTTKKIGGDLRLYFNTFKTHYPLVDFYEIKAQELLGKLFRIVEHMSWYVDCLYLDDMVEQSMNKLQGHKENLDNGLLVQILNLC